MSCNLYAYHFCTVIKLKNHKLNHQKPGLSISSVGVWFLLISSPQPVMPTVLQTSQNHFPLLQQCPGNSVADSGLFYPLHWLPASSPGVPFPPGSRKMRPLTLMSVTVSTGAGGDDDRGIWEGAPFFGCCPKLQPCTGLNSGSGWV